jgi:methylglutaconyl-CoA hydratase
MVITHSEKRILWIKMNRPEKRNALNSELVGGLIKEIKKGFEDSDIKVLILSGEGKAFCSGADLAYLKKLQGFSFEENLADSRQLKDLFYLIYSGPKPVIAAINGHAIAGGAGLASVCDIALSVPEAKFGFTEVKIGFVPALVMVFLIRKIGEGKTREILLKGSLFSAESAMKYGLIHKLVPGEHLMQEVKNLALLLCNENAGESMKAIKVLLTELQETGLKSGLEIAAKKNAAIRETDECKTGVKAFLEKKKPNW